MKREVGYMKKEMFLKIIKEMSSYRNRSIWLHLFGEPLLYPDLIWAIKSIKKFCKDSKVNLSTNCMNLDEEIGIELLNSGLDRIRLCIDTINPEIYSKSRIKGDFNSVKDNIKRFLEVRKAKANILPLVEIQYIPIVNKGENLKQFADYWKSYLSKSDKIHVQRFSSFAGNISNTFNLPDGNISPRSFFRKKLPCLRLWKEISIYWNGDVTGCCYDFNGALKIGSIIENSIEDIWHGEKIKRLRDAQIRRDFSKILFCLRCINK